MRKYIRANPLEQAHEQVHYTARLSLWALTGHAVVCAMILLCKVGLLLDWIFDFSAPAPALSPGTLALLAAVAFSAYLKYRTTELVVTSRRVIARFGVFKRTTVEIVLAKVESVQVEQSILARLLNYGSIVVAGGGMHSAPVRNIAKPGVFRSACAKAQLSGTQP